MLPHRSTLPPICLALTFLLVALANAAPITLENDALRVTIDPEQGGALTGFLLREENVNLVSEPTATESMVLPSGTRVPLDETAFDIVESTAAHCLLRTMLPENPQRDRRTGAFDAYLYWPQDDLTKVRLDKRYELAPDARGCRIVTTWTNTADAPITLSPAYARRFLTGLRGVREAFSGRERPILADKDDRLFGTYFNARRGGVMETGAEAWVAFQRAQRGGVVAGFDPRFIGGIRRVPGGRNSEAATEAVGTRMTLQPGESVTVASWIQPFEGDLTALAGVGGGLIGTATLSPPVDLSTAEILEGKLEDVSKFVDVKRDDMAPSLGGIVPLGGTGRKGYRKGDKVRLTLTLTSAVPREVTLTAEARRLPTDEPFRLGAKPVALQAGRPEEIALGFTPGKVGTYQLLVHIDEGDKRLCTLVRPLTCQGPSGFTLRTAPEGRRGEVFREWGRFDPFSIHREPSLEISVPHLTYARPYAAGTPRVTLVVPWQNGREAVEILQRIDLDADIVYAGAHGFMWDQKLVSQGHAMAPPEEVNALKDALNKAPRAIIMIGTPATWFGDEVAAEIVRQVREGAGLVAAPLQGFPDAIKDLTEGALPRRPWPGDGSTAVTLGKGRVVFFPAAGSSRSYRPQVALSELKLEQFSRAILWAAGMEPEVLITPEAARVRFDNTQATDPIPLTVKNTGRASVSGTLEIVARQERAKDWRSVYGRSYGLAVMLTRPYALLEEVWRTEVPLNLAAGEERAVSFTPEGLRAGTYRIHAVLRDKQGGVITWEHLHAIVTSSVSVAGVEIEKRPADDKRLFGFRRQDGLTLRAAFKAKGTPGDTLTAFLIGEDKTGRRVVDIAQPIAFDGRTAETTFQADLHGALYNLLILRFGLKQGDRTLVEDRRPLLMRESPGRAEKFRFCLLDNESNLPLQRTGFSDQMGPYAPTLFAWYEMQTWQTGNFLQAAPVRDRENREVAAKIDKLVDALAKDNEVAPDLGRIKVSEDEKVFVRTPCFNNPHFIEDRLRTIRKVASAKHDLGPKYVHFTHEYTYGSVNPCQCRFCVAAFREQMKAEYGTLDALNAQWGTDHAAWDDVAMYLVGKDMEPAPMADWPRAIDTQRWKSTQLMNLAHKVQAAGNELTDDIDWGHIALYKMGLWIGMDFWDWSRGMNRHIQYRDDEEWKSLSGPSTSYGWYSGYGRQYNPAVEQYKIWRELHDDTWGIAHFTSPAYPMAREDGVFFDGAEALTGNLKEVHRGWGELLLGRGHKDGVGIYRSTPSFWVHMMEFWTATEKNRDHRSDGAMDWERRLAHFLFGQGPRQAESNYLWHGHVAEGNFGEYPKPKVILLSYTTALTEAEAETLRKFVAEGGTLIGGANVATRDWKGKPHATPLLDGLFGIEHTAGYQPALEIGPKDEPVTVTFDQPVAGVTALEPIVLGPGNIRPTGAAKALAHFEVNGERRPAWIVNTVGKGRTVYANFLMLHTNQNNGVSWTRETARACSALAGKAIADAGVAPFSWIETGDDTPVRVDMGRFKDADNLYAVPLATPGYAPHVYAAMSARLKLAEPRHVYDSRRGRYLGEGTEFDAIFQPEMLAPVYAMLPYRLEGVHAADTQQWYARGKPAMFEVRLTAEGRKPGRHVLRVTVDGPDGKPIDVHAYNLIVDGDRAMASVHLGFNEPTGRWALHIVDRATGLRADHGFTVK